METNNIPQSSDSIAVRFAHVLQLIIRGWKTIIITMVVVIAIAAVYIFSLPRVYESECTLLPETSSSSGGISGNLGSLASMAGIKMGDMGNQDAIYPEFYPKVVSSTVFLAELLKDQVTCKRTKSKTNVYVYFRDKQQKAWWAKMMPKGEEKKDSSDVDNFNINPTHISKKQQKVVDDLSGAITCMVDKKTDMITVRVEVQDADVAQQIADLVCKRLQTYITRYRTNKARKDVTYSEAIAKNAYDKYIKSQTDYAAFCDTHEDVTLTSYQQVQDRLENEMQLAFNTYSQCAQQLQLAKMKLQERTPVYTTIQPATVPQKPCGPKRVFTILAFTMLSFFGSVCWILMRDMLKKKQAN